jgi:methyltransferase (TIGR00027 family)
MKIPDLSYMTTVGQLRYIQSRFEGDEYRNPDTVVYDFLTIPQRLGSMIRGMILLPKMRSKPFYYYINSRTKYYDQVFLDAIESSVDFIINIGCGIDTRAHRFADLLRQKHVAVVECDQPAAIYRKRAIASRRWPADQVSYVPIDLNSDTWPEFESWVAANQRARVLVMMEGVCAYVKQTSFESFLRFLGRTFVAGSVLAYDFKIAGVDDDFGRSQDAQPLFRLAADRGKVAAFHEALGYRLDHIEQSFELSQRLLPALVSAAQPLFREDCLVRLAID